MDSTDAATLVPGADVWPMLFKSMGMLCIVLAALIGLLLLIKKLSSARSLSGERDTIKMLASYHVSPKDKVMLLDVMGEKILLGVTTQNINYLTTIMADGDIEPAQQSEAGFFDGILKGILDKKDKVQAKIKKPVDIEVNED